MKSIENERKIIGLVHNLQLQMQLKSLALSFSFRVIVSVYARRSQRIYVAAETIGFMVIMVI